MSLVPQTRRLAGKKVAQEFKEIFVVLPPPPSEAPRMPDAEFAESWVLPDDCVGVTAEAMAVGATVTPSTGAGRRSRRTR